MPSDGDEQGAQPAARLDAAGEPQPDRPAITGSSRPAGQARAAEQDVGRPGAGLPIQLRTGPAASVFSDGSLG